jgi:hypothetical protein
MKFEDCDRIAKHIHKYMMRWCYLNLILGFLQFSSIFFDIQPYTLTCFWTSQVLYFIFSALCNKFKMAEYKLVLKQYEYLYDIQEEDNNEKL